MRRPLILLFLLAPACALFLTATLAPCRLPRQFLAKSPACPASAAALAALTPREEPPAVTVAVATRRLFVDRLFLSGTLAPREEVQASARLDGLAIVAVLAEDGDRVSAGQTLARLDRTQLDAQRAENDAASQRADAAVQQARDLITQSEAQFAYASAEYDRAEKLGAGVMSASAVEQRAAAMKSAQAQLSAAHSALGVAEADRTAREADRRELDVRAAHTEVTAPVAGLVSRRAAKLGAIASSAGEPLFRIIVDGAVDLDAEAPEDGLHRLAAGMPAQVKAAGLEAPISAHVRLVNQEVDRSSRTGKARIALDDASAVHIGAFASAEVDTARRMSVGVPASAVKRDGESADALVVADGEVEDRKVVLGVTDGDVVEIREGLTEGESIVVRAAAFLRPGDRVRPMIQTAMAAE